METHVDEGTPLHDYLEGTGEKNAEPLCDTDDFGEASWSRPKRETADTLDDEEEERQTDFAPRGVPTLKNPRPFRHNVPNPLKMEGLPKISTAVPSLSGKLKFMDFKAAYVEATKLALGQSSRTDFIDQLRYIINSSIIINPQPAGDFAPIDVHASSSSAESRTGESPALEVTAAGTFSIVAAIFGLTCLVSWIWARRALSSPGGIIGLLLVTTITSLAVGFWWRVHSLKALNQATLANTQDLVTVSQEFDNAASAALRFIMEVELVSRGFRIGYPLPPASRLDTNDKQNFKCADLRKVLKLGLEQLIPAYLDAASALKALEDEGVFLLMFSGYSRDISYQEILDKYQVYRNFDPDQAERIQELRDALQLFREVRKVFGVSLLALNGRGDERDTATFGRAVQSISELRVQTRKVFDTLRPLLVDEDFQMSNSPKSPLSPGHEKWQHQIRKLSSLNNSIRSIQAKLYLLRDESSKALGEADDISALGPMFMSQYEGIGRDLNALMEAWEAGKSSLSADIDKNEKRLSSLSSIMSPTSPRSSLSGLTTVEEGGVLEAYRALNGDSPSPAECSTPITPPEQEVFEAIAIARPRSLLTRDERIAKMRDEREAKAMARERAQARGHLMSELQEVMRHRPTRRGPGARIMSM